MVMSLLLVYLTGIVTSTPAPSHGRGNDGSFIVTDTANDSNTAAGDSFRKLTHGTSKVCCHRYREPMEHTTCAQWCDIFMMVVLAL